MIYNTRAGLTDESPAIDVHMKELMLVLNAPLVRLVKKHIKETPEEIAKRAPKATLADITALRNLGRSSNGPLTSDSALEDARAHLRGAVLLAEMLSEDIVRYILIHGFSEFGAAHGESISKETLARVNAAALDYYKKEMTRDPAELEEDYGMDWRRYLEKKCERLAKVDRLS
jgi:hypothetical protein